MLVKIGFMVQMLKRALSETGEMCEPGEEDKQSHHRRQHHGVCHKYVKYVLSHHCQQVTVYQNN